MKIVYNENFKIFMEKKTMLEITDDLETIQRIEIDILDYIAEICCKNNLTYFLAGGTLLGAVRHKGFIPWDNDIDISMPRADYRKFIDYMETQNESPYKILHISNHSNYDYAFAKVVDSRTKVVELARDDQVQNMGIFVDIFPIDSLPDKSEETIEKFLKINRWGCRIANAESSKKEYSFPKRIFYMSWKYLIRMLGRERCMERIDNSFKSVPIKDSNYIVSTYGMRGVKEIIEADAFSKTIPLPFEGKLYNAPIGYDQYLKQMYGDYMKLPPKEQQVMPHEQKVYIDESLKDQLSI